MTPVADLKQSHRDTWAAGDYAAVAEHIDDAPPADLLERLPIAPGQDLLDVATGTGNLALRAAARGARVVGLDLTPELLEIAAQRSQWTGLHVEWVEGDAEDLPFDDETFDVITSVFGVQFAPRHYMAADELVRVCRPGGRIGLVSWTPDGLIGQLFRVMSRYLPPAPGYASPPPLWGNPDHLRSLFAGSGIEWRFARGHNPWRFSSADAFTTFLETFYGPLVKARERLTAEGTWDACRSDIVALAERLDEGADGSSAIGAEYLVAVGRKGH